MNAFSGEQSLAGAGQTAADTAAPVLVSVSSPQSIGSNLFQAHGQQSNLIFSESLSGAPSEAELEAAVTFAGGATDGDNLPTLGTGANPISLQTSFQADDTIRDTFNTDNTANADRLVVGTHTVQVTDATNVTDTASNTANTAARTAITGNTNDAPVLDNAGTMVLTNINEDDTAHTGDTVGSIIASAGGDPITDADTIPVEGIAVIGADNSNGQWQYNTGSGWTAFGAVTNTSAVLLNTAASIRFLPNSDYTGSAGNITFRAWDQTDGNSNGATAVNVSSNGDTTAYSSATETASVSGNMLTDDDGAGLDADLDGDTLSVSAIDATGADQYGTLTLDNANGDYT